MSFFKLMIVVGLLSGASISYAAPEEVKAEEVLNSKGLQAFKKNLYTPILQQQCVKCHGNAGPGPNHSSEDIITSYKMIQRYVDFMDIKSSKLVTKGSNGHGNGYDKTAHVTVTSDELIKALQGWWDDGENTAFIEGKKVLSQQMVNNLPQDGTYKTMAWDLGQSDPELKGTKFQIDIQRFITKSDKFKGAYKLKNPRLTTNNTPVEIKSINIIMNGIWDSSANNYAALDYVVKTKGSEEAILSPFKQIVLESKGEGQDQMTIAFKSLKRAENNQKITFVADTTSLVPDKSGEKKVVLAKNPVFDESVVGKAGHFVKITATAQNPVEFEMGSPEGQVGRYAPFEKLHKVKITKSYEIQSTDVTQFQWYMVMKDTAVATPSYFKSQQSCDTGNLEMVKANGGLNIGICKNHPVEQVSWNDAKEFIKKLNQMQNEYVYSLPTEAQWEYVAKSGLPSEYAYGWGGDFDGAYAWFSGNSQNRTHEVATKNGVPSPQDQNEFVFDMSGNVWQWMEDWHNENYGLTEQQLKTVVQDPTGPTTGSYRVVRGGGWNNFARDLRSAFRYYGSPADRYGDFGFRLVRTFKK